ncbi:MAG: hypothetical protein AAF629_09240 [Chloroflexota bacterium]
MGLDFLDLADAYGLGDNEEVLTQNIGWQTKSSHHRDQLWERF